MKKYTNKITGITIVTEKELTDRIALCGLGTSIENVKVSEATAEEIDIEERRRFDVDESFHNSELDNHYTNVEQTHIYNTTIH